MNRPRAEKRPPGVIETLSSGFEFVVRRPALLVIPVLLDLFYWLGPRLSFLPLVERFLVFVNVPPGAAPEMAQAVAQTRETLRAFGEASNLFALLSPALVGMPSLVIGDSDLASARSPVILLDNALVVLALSGLFTLIGLLLAALLLVLIVRQLRAESGKPLVREVIAVWQRLVLLIAILLVGTFVLVFPYSVVLGLLSLLSPIAASFLLTFGFVALVWLSLYLFFTVDAIVLQGVMPIRAMWFSANVIQANFWPSLALIILVNVLNAGLGLVWVKLSALPGGELLGIIANSLVGVSLIAASLMFFRDRFERWNAARQANVSSTTALQ